jgi:hypothetical protein
MIFVEPVNVLDQLNDLSLSIEGPCTMVMCLVFVQEEVRAKLPKYQRQTPVKTVDSSTSTPQPQVEVCTKKYLYIVSVLITKKLTVNKP